MSIYDAWWQGQSTHAGQTVGQHLRSWLHMFDRDSLGVTHRLVAQKEPVSPACDVRESRDAYFFDVELPGVADVGAVALRWPSSRTLVIEAKAERVDVRQEWAALDLDAHVPCDSCAAPDRTECGCDPYRDHPLMLFGERRIGPVQRTFTFPVDVESDELKARLDAGLLKLRVQKTKEDARVAGKTI